MLQHSPARRCRVTAITAATTIASAATLLSLPSVASADPRPDHAAIDDTAIDDTAIDDTAAQQSDTEPGVGDQDDTELNDTGQGGTETPDELLDACPVDAGATYEDSWGWSRSGGRSHEGVDMVADRGSPVIAVRDGDALFKRNSLGGNAIWLTAANGDKFYYAHLDAFFGEGRTVRAGDLIGFVGSTGNAQGPHLHFETLPSGNVENPYPHTVAACVPTPDEVAAILQAEANALSDPTLWERFIPAS